ncbi:MAG: hypothetical protein ABEJ79_07245 [Halolamina sp.]
MFGIETGVLVGAVGLGLVHGVEPGHGWPVAATYALDHRRKWAYGFAASLLLGVGHLVSSVAMVAAYFLTRSAVDTSGLSEPVTVGGVALGSPAAILAGALLVALGVRELRGDHGHGHGHGGGHADEDHDHDDHEHEHEHAHDHHDHSHGDDHADADDGLSAGVLGWLPFVGDDRGHPSAEAAAERGLWGIAGFAFLLGFAHEEEFQIIGLCVGSDACLLLMLVYATTVIVGIVTLTLLLVAGYERYEDRVAGLAEYLPMLSGAILVGMGLGFAAGLF